MQRGPTNTICSVSLHLQSNVQETADLLGKRQSKSSVLLHLQSYVQEIAVLLLQDSANAESHARLNQLASETSVLIGIIKSLNPQAFSVFNGGDKGQAGSPGLDKTFYSKLAVS